MIEYRVLAGGGGLCGRWDSEAAAVAHARRLAERIPHRAPFRVQRVEWIDVPLPEPLPVGARGEDA